MSLPVYVSLTRAEEKVSEVYVVSVGAGTSALVYLETLAREIEPPKEHPEITEPPREMYDAMLKAAESEKQAQKG